MGTRGVEIITSKSNAAHAQVISHIDDRSPILVQFVLRHQGAADGAGRRTNCRAVSSIAEGNRGGDTAKETAGFLRRTLGLFYRHACVSRSGGAHLAQPVICVANLSEKQLCVESSVNRAGRRVGKPAGLGIGPVSCTTGYGSGLLFFTDRSAQRFIRSLVVAQSRFVLTLSQIQIAQLVVGGTNASLVFRRRVKFQEIGRAHV